MSIEEGTPAEAFAEGLRGTFEPVIKACDASVMEVLQSQEALATQIDRLSTGLCAREIY